ncbi:EAL domain-containing protein [Nitrincola sp. MINF-07-Sa-05]|uniref:EAL domain-containing protein n=1 Tax=Nitrincola salilacus TaxID=3400273 RepID=UPI003917F74B
MKRLFQHVAWLVSTGPIALLLSSATFAAERTASVTDTEVISVTLLIITLLLLMLLGNLLRRLQKSKARSEQARLHLHDAVESLSEAFALFDRNGRLLLCNQRWLDDYPWLKDNDCVYWDEICKLNASHLLHTGCCASSDGKQQRNYLEQLADGRWLQASDNPTQEGGIACVRTDITRTQEAELALKKLGRAMEQSPVSVMITDTLGIIEYINPRFSEVTGYSTDEVIGQHANILKSGEMPESVYQHLWDSLQQGEEWHGQLLNRKKDGTLFWESSSISALRDHDGNTTHFIAVKEDITIKKEAEDQLRMIATVFETSTEAIMIADAEGRIKMVNNAFCRITGYTPEEVIGESPSLLSSGRHSESFYEEMWNAILVNGYWSGEIWNRRKDGNIYPEWLSISAINDASGMVKEFVAVFSDITQRKKDEAHIRHQAYYDALTQLPNRALLADRLEVAIVTADRDNQKIALLFVDLDRFKNVNDTLGHEFGDDLLLQVAERLISCVRESDTVARFGGDEFVILLHNISSDRDAALIAEKLIKAISDPFVLSGREIFIGASIGIALHPGDSETADALLRNADLAMYRAKQTGRNRFQFFTSALQETANTLMEMEQDLRIAMEQSQLEIYYQPLVMGSSGRITGVEALLRWHHPRLGMVSPETFIPLAEDTGLIGPIGLWVLETACSQLTHWNSEGHHLYLSVNISGRQRDLGLDATQLASILDKTGFKPDQLVLEITEGLLLDYSDDTIVWLQAFKDIGVHLAIDDFGTGYSSLSYLKRFPIDTLKIDREFVRDLTQDSEDALLVEAIISMAKSLKLRLIAEGVETEEQRQLLDELGCQFQQGYLFARPLPANALKEWLLTYKPERIRRTSEHLRQIK